MRPVVCGIKPEFANPAFEYPSVLNRPGFRGGLLV
jgi:hypothetical protein